MNSSRPKASVRYDNSGRVVLVTGGTQGIGKAIVEAYAASGAKVVSMDVKAATGADLPKGVEFVQGDVSREDDCRRAVETAVQKFGGLDVLVNNAAIQSPSSYMPVHKLEQSAWDRMIAVNLSGYYLMAKHALPVMLKQHSGVVVNLASGQAHRTMRQVPAYGPIKAANLMQTMQWGVEYARENIRVVSISPGTIDTPLVRASLAEQGGEAALANRHPLGRLGKPEEIAHAVLWLSSDDAAFVTGTDLAVDGGLGALGSFADPYPMK